MPLPISMLHVLANYVSDKLCEIRVNPGNKVPLCLFAAGILFLGRTKNSQSVPGRPIFCTVKCQMGHIKRDRTTHLQFPHIIIGMSLSLVMQFYSK